MQININNKYDQPQSDREIRHNKHYDNAINMLIANITSLCENKFNLCTYDTKITPQSTSIIIGENSNAITILKHPISI